MMLFPKLSPDITPLATRGTPDGVPLVALYLSPTGAAPKSRTFEEIQSMEKNKKQVIPGIP